MVKEQQDKEGDQRKGSHKQCDKLQQRHKVYVPEKRRLF